MKSWAFAFLAACITISSVAPGNPMRMFCLILASNSTGSCETTPICFRKYLTLISLMSTPSIITLKIKIVIYKLHQKLTNFIAFHKFVYKPVKLEPTAISTCLNHYGPLNSLTFY